MPGVVGFPDVDGGIGDWVAGGVAEGAADETGLAGARRGDGGAGGKVCGIVGVEGTENGAFGCVGWLGVVDVFDEGGEAEGVGEENEFLPL